MTAISFAKSTEKALKDAAALLVLAPKRCFDARWHEKAFESGLAARLDRLAKDTKPGPLGRLAEGRDQGPPARLVAAVLPDVGSRHNSPTRSEAVLKAVKDARLAGRSAIVLCVEEEEHLEAALCAVARALPLFSRKTEREGRAPAAAVAVCAVKPDGAPLAVPARAKALVDSLRWAAKVVDTPAAEMTTVGFAKAVQAHVRGLAHVTVRTIAGEALVKEGLGGIRTVGQAAAVPPRLVILDYRPPKAKRTVALVGKGIVYDTGGLSLKPTEGMMTMKCDMAGAAATAAAFQVLAQTKAPHRVVALLAMAENAIGPGSYRNGDILTLHSGLTVEINNTDAEGRLLLADAVSFAGRKIKPDLVIDAATLTGAQLIATGERHAAVVSNRAGLEAAAVAAGRRTGDLCFPLPFAPEFYQAEFQSEVADMKNSVKNRMNAQSSCAAQFVYRHIDDLDLAWLHVDLAGPAFRAERGTGFGVALLEDLVRTLDDAALAP